MARTQAADYDQRRESIVDQAARLYAKSGFLGASVSDLAEACGASKSAIYHYFPSKEDILFEVMDSHIAALDEAAKSAVRADASGAENLRALAHAFMAIYAHDAERQKVLLNELDHLPADRRASIVARQRALIESVKRLLAQIEPALARAPARNHAAAMLFFGMINWTHTWFDPKGRVTPDELAEMAVRMALGGVNALA